jgi:hypothetical protein
MPHYFFDLDDHRRDLDKSGLDCTGDQSAANEGARFAGEHLRDNAAQVVADGRMQVAVVDESDRNVARITITVDFAGETN